MARIHVTTTIDEYYRNMVKDELLSFSECLEFGISFKRAERRDIDYPDNILSHKIKMMADRLAEAYRRIAKLEEGKIGEKKFTNENYLELTKNERKRIDEVMEINGN